MSREDWIRSAPQTSAEVFSGSLFQFKPRDVDGERFYNAVRFASRMDNRTGTIDHFVTVNCSRQMPEITSENFDLKPKTEVVSVVIKVSGTFNHPGAGFLIDDSSKTMIGAMLGLGPDKLLEVKKRGLLLSVAIGQSEMVLLDDENDYLSLVNQEDIVFSLIKLKKSPVILSSFN